MFNIKKKNYKNIRIIIILVGVLKNKNKALVYLIILFATWKTVAKVQGKEAPQNATTKQYAIKIVELGQTSN